MSICPIFFIYVLEKREWILCSPHQNLGPVYCLRTSRLMLKNLDLDVPILFLYPYVGRPDKYHQDIIEAHHPQPAEYR